MTRGSNDVAPSSTRRGCNSQIVPGSTRKGGIIVPRGTRGGGSGGVGLGRTGEAFLFQSSAPSPAPYNSIITKSEARHKKKHTPNNYTKLKRDEDWLHWVIKFKRKAREDAYKHVLDENNELQHCSIGADCNLLKLQVNFLAMVLEFCLETSIGQFFVTTYIDGNARYVWFAVKNHYFTSSLALYASNQILTKLQNLNISTFTKLQDFLTQVQEFIQRYDQINPKNTMTTKFKINTLHNVVSKDKMLISSWVNYQEIHTAYNQGQQLIINYHNFLDYILKMSIAHNQTSPLSNHHANLILTNQYGTDDDSSVDITHISVHLAELDFFGGECTRIPSLRGQL